MKHLPKLITSSPFVHADAIVNPSAGAWFYNFHSLCSLSAMLYGWLARKIGSDSKLGANQDSAADFAAEDYAINLTYPKMVHKPDKYCREEAGACIIKTSRAYSRRRMA